MTTRPPGGAPAALPENAFAEFGEGHVGGYAIGDFKVTNYMEKDTTGREVAMEAAFAELAGTSLSFCGVA